MMYLIVGALIIVLFSRSSPLASLPLLGLLIWIAIAASLGWLS